MGIALEKNNKLKVYKTAMPIPSTLIQLTIFFLVNSFYFFPANIANTGAAAVADAAFDYCAAEY